jgi:uncharacterized protein YkwD
MKLARTLPRAAIAAAAATVSLTAAAPASAACANSDAMPAATNTAAIEQATLCLLNQQRAAHGLRALRRNAKLDTASQGHSDDMVRRSYFEHDTPDGVSVVDRLRRVRYMSDRYAWTVGENIAWGQDYLASPAEIMKAWMNSPGHRANILARDYREIGVGVTVGVPVKNSDPYFAGGTYTTDFGWTAAPSASTARARARARTRARARAAAACRRKHPRSARCAR